MEIKAQHFKSNNQKNKGLLGEKEAFNAYFETRFGIHTFFLKFPIDVVILDKNHRVVVVKERLSQNTKYLWNVKYFKVLELKSGEVERLGIKKGQKIKLFLT